MSLSLLASCTVDKNAQCQQILAVTDQSMTTARQINQENLGGSAYDLLVEQQVAQIYFDTSQTVERLEISNKKLQNIQISLVEVYQKASDERYQAVGLIPLEGLPSAEQKQQIDALRHQAEADILSAIQPLKSFCGERETPSPNAVNNSSVVGPSEV